jgi:pyridoxine kinase
MNILSIQSHVAYGHVGNSSAVFPMQRLGHEVWPIHTVQFSNHTGYPIWKGRVFEAGLIDECVEGIAAQGALARCDGVLSGYIGSVEIGEAILRAVARIKAANPHAIFCCDPVMGDTGRGLYVRPEIPDFFAARALPLSDLLTPNHFELEQLTRRGIDSRGDLIGALTDLKGRGPKTLLVTSLAIEDTPEDKVDNVAADATGIFRIRTPKLGISVNGTGDAIAALFLVHWLETRSAAMALGKSVSSVYGLLDRTAAAGSRELLTVEAQDEFVAPTRIFIAEPF